MSFVPGDRGQLVIASTHDGRPIGDAERINVTLEVRHDTLVVSVEARYHGDPPPSSPPGPTPRLWEHEVVELMILGAEEHYLEVELGPHGHHLLLELAGVRRVVEQGHPLPYRAAVHGDRWRGEATVPRSLLPPRATRLNAFAIHGLGDARRYLAWHPPNGAGEAPDFHRLDAFAPWSAVVRRAP